MAWLGFGHMLWIGHGGANNNEIQRRDCIQLACISFPFAFNHVLKKITCCISGEVSLGIFPLFDAHNHSVSADPLFRAHHLIRYSEYSNARGASHMPKRSMSLRRPLLRQDLPRKTHGGAENVTRLSSFSCSSRWPEPAAHLRQVGGETG
jgi:hypothetical protein